MKTKRNEAIAALRQVIERTQTEFAAMIGATRDAVVSWECGRNRLSREYAYRIEMATGCAADCVLRGRATLMDVFGRPYTRADYDDWRKRIEPSDAATARRYTTRAADSIGLLLEAAAQPGRGRVKDRLPGLWTGFVQWARDAAQDFKLGPELDAILSRRRIRQSVTITYGDARQMDLRARKLWAFKDDRRKPDSASITLTMETHPAWNPGGDMGSNTHHS